MLLNLALILIIVFLVFILSMVWPPDSPWSPWWRTNKKVARKAFKLVNLTEEDVVFELGSGEGRALMIAAKEFGARGVGIEIDPLRYYLSKLLVWKNGLTNKIELKRGNFFKYDISEASVVFVYLVPKALERLRPKFERELKKGTRIVSYKYEMNLLLVKEDKENELRLYTV